MSTTVQTIYDQVCHVVNEPGGLVLGIVTEAQFLHTLAVVLLDFSQRAPLDKQIYTTRIVSGTSSYTVPDIVMSPQLCFVNGRLVEKVSESDLAAGHYEWKRKTGPTKQWHEDNLEVKHLELFPIPDWSGTAIVGGGKYGDFYPGERNLTMVGPGAPSKTSWALSDTLDGISDSFVVYLTYGILAQLFGSESELRDPQRASYCKARYEESFVLADALIHAELIEEEDDD